jgi:hypothetical protein
MLTSLRHQRTVPTLKWSIDVGSGAYHLTF